MRPLAAPRPARRRRGLVAAAALVVLVGVTGRFLLPGSPGDLVGGVAYTALVYVVLAWLRPRTSVLSLAAGAWAFSAAVELLQLTSAPRELVDAWPGFRLLVGTTFVASDLVAYAVGAAIAAAIDLRPWRRERTVT